MTKRKDERVKMMCSLAMLAAIAVVVDMFLRVSVGGFLTYEPKDVVITIGAYIFGPVAGLAMAAVVCLIEMVTISHTGIIGFLMNFLASGVFVGVASVIYMRDKRMSKAIIGLIAGSLSMIAIMLLWNYIMTPIYMGVPRDAVIELMIPLLLPFNAIKAGLNSALVLFLYKGVVTALRKSKLVPVRNSNDGDNKRTNTVIAVCVSALCVATMVLVLLSFAGILKY